MNAKSKSTKTVYANFIFLFIFAIAIFGIGTCLAQDSGSPEFDEADAWVFNPAKDEFKDTSMTDLRFLNEKQSGEAGFIKLSEDGMSFVKGDGTPIRFWSAVDDSWRAKPEKMVEHLRYMAKFGINMIRVHAQLYKSAEGDKITDFDKNRIDGIMRYVAEAKKLGMYVTISPYWAHLDKIPASWEIPGYTGKSGPTNLLFFYKPLQDGYKEWVRPLYTQVNPYTGIALKDDPTVAIVQIQNEDSLFFWTFSNLQGPLKGEFRKMFGDWCIKKHGSLKRTKVIWKEAGNEEDNFEAGEIGLIGLWSFTAGAPKPTGGMEWRMADQMNFMAEVQYNFHKDIADFYKNELGCKQIINASNWRSADPVLLEDIERWTYTANEVAAINRYTGGVHSGPMNGWRVDPGHFFTSESCLTHPESFPGALKQTVDQPMIITEAAWVHPTLYQSEGPFMMAAYHSMTGVDSLYWFAYDGGETWTVDPVWPYWNVDGKTSLKKWYGSYPMQAGMFPATAIAYRLGYIKPADKPVVYEEKGLKSLWYRKAPIIAEAGKFDVNRDEGDFAPQSPVKQEVDRLAFMAGPVHVKFGGSERNSRVAKLSNYIDRDKGTVKSVTGEIDLDYKTGLCKVDTPKFQGVTGFLTDAGGRFELNDVTIESKNDYATIVASALDNKPLAKSGKILIQVGTVCRPTGWRVKDAELDSNGRKIKGKEIIDAGKAPWLVKNTKATVTINNSKISKATLLDVGGYPVSEVPVEKSGETVKVKLPANAMYVVLQ